MHIYPQRASLQGLEDKIFKLVSYCATLKQWAEWLRVPLEHAAAHGNLDLVNKLLGAGANGGAGWRGCRGRTLLDAAALGGNADVLAAFIRAGAGPDVNVVSVSSRRSALYTATCCGHEDAARGLVLAGADVNFQDPAGEFGVLHEAVVAGHDRLVKDLLISGANPNTPTADGSAPLRLAACEGHGEIVSALLLGGANKDATDKDGKSPLVWAASKDHLSIVNTLLAAGADFKIRSSDGAHTSALDWAASKGHVRVLKAILDRGADVNASSNQGIAALHRAAMNNQVGTIDALIEEGADIELKTTGCGTAPLLAAAARRNNCCEAMLALLRHGAAVNTRGDDGYTILHWVCYLQRPGVEEIVSLLLRWGADETAYTNNGDTSADLVGAPKGEDFPRCSQGTLERVLTLLARAPADRAWRRRCWLVMLHSRVSRAWGAASHTGDEEWAGPNVSGDRESEGCKAPRIEDASRIESGVRERQANNRALDVVAAEGDGSKDLRGVIKLVVGLELEDVFRTVVSFV